MVLEQVGFVAFYAMLSRVEGLTTRRVTRGVVKRLWGKTNTFHLPFGELTITPFNFAMLMGLVLVGELLVYQEDFYTYRD